MSERQIPRPGEFYRHFKNRLYQVKAVAYDAETQAPVVVYQALYGDFRCWIRPLDNFLSETDHEKYPDVTQKWRFERVTLTGDGSAVPAEPDAEGMAAAASEIGMMHCPEAGRGREAAGTAAEQGAGKPSGAGSRASGAAPENARQTAAPASETSAVPAPAAMPGKILTDFLDTEDRQLRKGILMANRNRITQGDLDSICLVLGIPAEGGDVMMRIRGICRYLDMQEQYEGDRMRQDGAFRIFGKRGGGGHV